MIYLGTSALSSLLIAEPQTLELQTRLTAQSGQGEYAVTSALGRVELIGVVAGYGEPGQTGRALPTRRAGILPLAEPLIALAEKIGPPALRSLDAIHLAAAAQPKRELRAFVTYDRRLLDGCREVGLPTASPGAPAR